MGQHTHKGRSICEIYHSKKGIVWPRMGLVGCTHHPLILYPIAVFKRELMAKLKVVALTSQALYSAGVINRLEQYSDQLDLVRIDVGKDDVMDVVENHHPQAVIIDTNFEDEVAHCPLEEFVRRVPAVKVIRLDPEREGFEVLTSEQHSASAVGELIKVLLGHSDMS